MSKTIFGLAAAILISLPYAALADGYSATPAPAAPGTPLPRMSPRQVFHWLDANRDGFLTLNEFLAAPWVTDKAQAAEFFQWLDTNHDGRLSLQEFLAGYTNYRGNSGYLIRIAYPWAWSYWRPGNYGWYWHTGWHRRPGTWPAYAVHVTPRAQHPYRALRHVAQGKHPHPARHHAKGKAKRHTKHKGHGHPHSHAKHHHK